MESVMHAKLICGIRPDRRSEFASRLIPKSSLHDKFSETRGGRSAIQKLLNGRKLIAHHPTTARCTRSLRLAGRPSVPGRCLLMRNLCFSLTREKTERSCNGLSRRQRATWNLNSKTPPMTLCQQQCPWALVVTSFFFYNFFGEKNHLF